MIQRWQLLILLLPTLLVMYSWAFRGNSVAHKAAMPRRHVRGVSFEILLQPPAPVPASSLMACHCSKTPSQGTARYLLTDHGWGVDIQQVVIAAHKAWGSGLRLCIETQNGGWHYSIGYPEWKRKKFGHLASSDVLRTPQQAPVCKNKDLSCYFQPLPCTAEIPKTMTKDNDVQLAWARQKLLVPHPWLQSIVDERVRVTNVSSPCAVLHVRRSDVVLNFGWKAEKKRPLLRYIPLKEYIETALPVLTRNDIKQILVITDSSAVIDDLNQLDAHHTAGRELIYLDRKRWRGSEGGWENHFPSGSALEEVVNIMTIEQAVKQCSVWIGTRSSFARFMQLGIRPKMKEVMLKSTVTDLNHAECDRADGLTWNITSGMCGWST